MKFVINITLSVLLFLLPRCLPAQTKQTIRGIVADQLLQQPLAGATISIPATHQNTTTNQEGAFRFSSMPVGQYRLIVSYTGYKEIALDNIAVNAGKETVLTVSLEALVKIETEVVVKASSKKNKPLNDLSTVSARAFTVEETQRYAAAVNDPLRMAAAFPGVMANDDGNNNIVIRGNSPTGLLWRMEGIDIPSPNHFSQPGLSGGGISILSSQLLANSDFVTAAFAAEYGNALSGVFDIKLRKGNNEKKEYALQAGVLGLNAAAEGPFSKNYKGSYLVNARYSTLTILSKIGVLPNDNTTNFSDLSYNIYLPTNKAGTFTLFGFGGLSDQVFSPDK
ncbi:MAG: carboxypeptidase regulatory-like domain-containing protein, partial [Flavihumibacter sp.]|nr:carboxypeptidase regulatory-like domain-containing protein [Flavihumibacter sp.]